MEEEVLLPLNVRHSEEGGSLAVFSVYRAPWRNNKPHKLHRPLSRLPSKNKCKEPPMRDHGRANPKTGGT